MVFFIDLFEIKKTKTSLPFVRSLTDRKYIKIHKNNSIFLLFLLIDYKL